MRKFCMKFGYLILRKIVIFWHQNVNWMERVNKQTPGVAIRVHYT